VEHVAILQPLSDVVDRRQREARQRRFRTEGKGGAVYYVAVTDRDPLARSPSSLPLKSETDPDLPVRFFPLIKYLTADRCYTSRVGLLQELRYAGNTALAQFPSSSVPEH